MNTVENSLWTEKYRPKNLDEYIGNDALKAKIKKYLDEGDVPHLLFYGKPGTGKTTLAKIIARHIDADVLYINASDENNLETVRNKIKDFASSLGFKQWRLIILDEADGLTPASQNALRNIIETFSKHCRFILTCNYVERIIEALQSRCRPYQIFPPSRGAVAKRVVDILTENNIVFKKEVLATIINKKYPDVRSIIELCQDNIVGTELLLDEDSIIESEYLSKLVSVLASTAEIKQKYADCRQILSDSKVTTFDELYRYLFDNLNDFAPLKIHGDIILLLAEYQYKDSFVVDKEINVTALLINILRELK